MKIAMTQMWKWVRDIRWRKACQKIHKAAAAEGEETSNNKSATSHDCMWQRRRAIEAGSCWLNSDCDSDSNEKRWRWEIMFKKRCRLNIFWSVRSMCCVLGMCTYLALRCTWTKEYELACTVFRLNTSGSHRYTLSSFVYRFEYT